MNENEKKAKIEAKNLITSITTYSLLELLREELGSELSFISGTKMIEGYINLFKNISNCDFDEIPMRQIDIITTLGSQAVAILNEMRDFSLQKYQNNPIGVRDQILKNIEEYYSSALGDLANISDYFKPKESFEKYQEEAKNALEQIRILKAELSSTKDIINQELAEILDTARQTVSEIGVASHAIHFKNEATENLNESKNWLIALIITVLLTIGWGIACFFIHPDTKDSVDVIQFTVAKLIIISGLYFALSMITKNYKAHRHNYIVNKHKQNSLNSFEAFVKGAGEDLQTKNAVLISATQSIFSAQPSGYSTQDTDNEPSKIIEILKTTSSSK
jgi:hypothetical protein